MIAFLVVENRPSISVAKVKNFPSPCSKSKLPFFDNEGQFYFFIKI